MGLRRKTTLWFAGTAGLMLALMIALFFLVPLYLNTPKIKARIEAGLSGEVGGKVTYERLGFPLFPAPQVKISGLQFSMPETATGTVKSVSLYPQLLSLLRGGFYLSTIALQEPDFRINLRGTATEQARNTTRTVEEVKAGIKPALAALEAVGPGFIFQAEGGSLVFVKRARPLASFSRVNARFVAPPGEMEVSVTALSDVWGPVALSGNVRLGDDKAEFENLAGTFGGSSFSGLSANLSFSRPFPLIIATGKADISLDEAYQWRSSFEGLAAALKEVKSLSGRIKISSLNFDGPLSRPEAWRAAASGNVEKFVIDVAPLPGPVAVASGSFTYAREKFSFSDVHAAFSFSGTLAQSTVGNIFSSLTFGAGAIEGKFQARVPIDQPLKSMIEGNLKGEDIVVPWGLAVPLKIDRFSLHGEGKVLTLDSVETTGGPSHFSLSGSVTASQEAYVLDLSLNSDGFKVEDIEKALAGPQAEKKPGKQHKEKRPRLPVRGVVQLKTASLGYGRYSFSPLEAVVTLNPGDVNAAITNAGVCGVAVAGTLGFNRQGVAIDLTSHGANLPLEQSAACLTGMDVSMTGTFDINAAINLRGKGGALLPSIEGKVDFKSKEGKIYRYPVLAKIFSVLSVTEIFRGKLPELGGSGFPYHTMTVKGRFHQGKFIVEEAFIDGSSLNIIAEGDVDLVGKKMDLVVLVSPFSTVNWVIRHIPLVGKILGGSLISVPVKVSGDMTNPDVTVLAPSAVGKRIIELLKNIVELPVEIISPLLPKEKKEEGK